MSVPEVYRANYRCSALSRRRRRRSGTAPPAGADRWNRIDRACSASDASRTDVKEGWAAWACLLLLDSPPVGDGGCTGESAG